MPIYKDDHGCLVLHFGHGDIAVDLCHKAGRTFNDEVAFHPGPTGEIGRADEVPDGTTTKDMGAVVRMAFDNKAAIQVVIDQLAAVRDQMPDGLVVVVPAEDYRCPECRALMVPTTGGGYHCGADPAHPRPLRAGEEG